MLAATEPRPSKCVGDANVGMARDVAAPELPLARSEIALVVVANTPEDFLSQLRGAIGLSRFA